MSPVAVTCRRTVSRARNLVTTAVVMGGFFASCAALFAFRLAEAEGTCQSLAVLWASSAAPFLPFLAAFLAADAWSEERNSGRLDILLSSAIKERDYVLGKSLGIWMVLVFATVLSLFSTVALIALYAPTALRDVRVLSFAPALVVLFLQGALWTAAASAVSIVFSRPFAALVSSFALLVALPRGLWAAAQLWAPVGRPAFGEMPLDAMVADFASGFVSSGPAVVIVTLTLMLLFFSSKSLLMLRFAGRGSRKRRFSTVVAIFMALLCAVSVSVFAIRTDVPFDLQIGTQPSFSSRLYHVLADSSGRVTVTAFLSRKSNSFRSVARYLRALKRQADVSGGLSLTLQYVDPDWDLGAAGRLVRLGAKSDSLVFEKGGRLVSLDLTGGFGDRSVGAALRSIAQPPQRRDVCWTTGHGEMPFNDYGPWGMSDISRELVRNGYRNESFDLAADRAIPPDCALIVIAGARETFSRAELNRLDAYLKGGGRLLVLMGPSAEAGVASMLPTWGIRPIAAPLSGARTLSGTDVIVSDFSDHVLSAGLKGSRIILEKPLSFVSSAVVGGGSGVDRLEFTPIATVGSACVIAAVERGGSAGNDLAVRPTRVVAVGDAMCVANGQLAARGHANADFFLNVVSYLSGSEVTSGGESESGVIVTGLDRAARVRFLTVSIFVFPCSVFLLMTLAALRRRNRL